MEPNVFSDGQFSEESVWNINTVDDSKNVFMPSAMNVNMNMVTSQMPMNVTVAADLCFAATQWAIAEEQQQAMNFSVLKNQLAYHGLLNLAQNDPNDDDAVLASIQEAVPVETNERQGLLSINKSDNPESSKKRKASAEDTEELNNGTTQSRSDHESKSSNENENENSESNNVVTEVNAQNETQPEHDKSIVYVRAKRGTATDRHSLAERERRRRIAQRFDYLRSMVPTCEAVTSKVAILDEIINYVQGMQQEVEILQLKLGLLARLLMQGAAPLPQNNQVQQSNQARFAPPVQNLVPSLASYLQSSTRSSVNSQEVLNGQTSSEWEKNYMTVMQRDHHEESNAQN